MNDRERGDFSSTLHALRGAELERLPANATTVLHGGAAGGWYFRWFDERYRGHVERHIGVEAFAALPPDLPKHVEWLPRTLGDIAPVASGSVDMVFGGQVIEHLWAEDVAGFLLESRRVLRDDGLLVLDSPNRRITEAIAWHQPEHTVELAVDEIATLLELAGFQLRELRGVMLGYDRARHVFLELDDPRMSWSERAELAADRPEDSFVWWLTAQPGPVAPDRDALSALAHAYTDAFRARRLARLTSPLPVSRATGRSSHVCSPRGYAGPLLRSPATPFAAGTWSAALALRLGENASDPDSAVASVEIVDSGGIMLARREVLAGDLDPSGGWTPVSVTFSLPAMTMGVELRLDARGQDPVASLLELSIRQPLDAATPPASSPAPTPEPRTVELIELLRRRAAGKARAAITRHRS